MTTARSDDPLAEIVSLGLHFAFRTRAPGTEPEEPCWQPLTDLLDGSPSLGARYEQTRAALAAGGESVPIRIGASIGHLGVVARLVCPTVAAAVLGYGLDLEDAWWQPTLGVMPISLPTDCLTPGSSLPDLIAGPVEALRERTAPFSLSRKILDGNVDSALNGAVMAIGRARPDLAEAAIEAGRTVRADVGPQFRRQSCCLIYQLSPPGEPSYCVDCVLPAGRPVGSL